MFNTNFDIDNTVQFQSTLNEANRLKNSTDLQQASRGFSALLIQTMLDSMRKTINAEDNPLYGGLARDIFDDMLYQEYAQQLAQSDALGLAALIETSLQR